MNPHKIIVGVAIALDAKQKDAYTQGMPKRTSKKQPTDVNLLAVSVVQAATAEKPASGNSPKKNPAAVALGRLGGLKGGKARAKTLTSKQRKDIARKAALARWAKAHGSSIRRRS